MKKRSIAVFFLVIFQAACAVRQVTPLYEGLTAQRLMSKSIDDGVQGMDLADLITLRFHKVYIDWHAFSTMKESNYIRDRFVVELQANKVQVVENENMADYTMVVFCTTSGTDNSFAGFETPAMTLSFMPLPQIQIIGLDLYEAEFGFYYFLKDADGNILKKSADITRGAKSNRFNFFLIGIPISH